VSVMAKRTGAFTRSEASTVPALPAKASMHNQEKRRSAPRWVDLRFHTSITVWRVHW
jgi:hypothetical protein